MMLFCFAAGIVSPSSNAGAMGLLPHRAGAAAAAIVSIVYAGSALFSGILTAQNLTVLGPLTIFICATSVLALVFFVTLAMRKQPNKGSQP